MAFAIKAQSRNGKTFLHPSSTISVRCSETMSSSESRKTSQSTSQAASRSLSHNQSGPMSLSSIVHEKDISCFQNCTSGAGKTGIPSELCGNAAACDTNVRLKNEKKRTWRKNLTPDQRNLSRQRDAERKRVKRRMLTESERNEMRKKDSLRKALKRRSVKGDADIDPSDQGADSSQASHG